VLSIPGINDGAFRTIQEKAVPHFKAFGGALHLARGLMATVDGFRSALLPLFEVDL
jgi:hypothetical protein